MDQPQQLGRPGRQMDADDYFGHPEQEDPPQSVPPACIQHCSDRAVLTCPHCGGEQMHQLRVEVFFRDEDADHGLYAGIGGDSKMVITGTQMTGNPSPRRDGIRVYYSCEHCPKTSALILSQHKGDSEIYWERNRR